MANSRIPPGPVNFNAAFGLTWRHYYCIRADPVGFYSQLGKRYGDISFFRMFWHRAFFINHPELIHALLVKNNDKIEKFDRIMDHLRVALGNGILVSEGDFWKRQRTILQRAFATTKMDHFADTTIRLTQRRLDRWSNGQRLAVETEMTHLLQDVMAKSFFDVEMDRSQQFAAAIREYSDSFHRDSRALFNWPRWLPLPSNRRKKHTLEIIQRSIREVIASRDATDEKHDLLSTLLSSSAALPGQVPTMTRQQATDEALTLFVAGYHTTSITLAWVLQMVASNPQVYQRVSTEVQEVLGNRIPTRADVARLKYIEMVIKETLRLYPSAWELFARQAKTEITLGDYVIPRGSLIFVAPIVTHRDPRFFPDPLVFDPDRFSPDREWEIPEFAYFPFGMGPHICIGKKLAMMQMCLIVASIFQRFGVCATARIDRDRFTPRVSIRSEREIFLRLTTPRPNPQRSPATQWAK